MAARIWPVSLPQVPLRQGFGESAQSPVIRTQMDVGPAKLRARYTAEVTLYNFRFLLTDAQVVTLETFYKTTLTFGSLRFHWTDHRLSTTIKYRFMTRPAYTQLRPDLWQTSFQLEQIP